MISSGTLRSRKTFCAAGLIIIFVMANISSVVFAEVSGAAFLKEETGARSLGMGSAFTAVVDDANSIFINPAGLGTLVAPEITAMYRKGIIDSYYGFVGYVQPLERIGVIEGSVLMYDGGSVDINYLDGSTETLKAEQDFVFSIGYGNNITPEISGGFNIKYITSTLAQRYSATAWAGDFGLLYRTLDSVMSFGVAVQNIGTKLTFEEVGDPLPMTVRAGAAYKVLETGTDSALAAADVVYEDSKVRFCVGGEYVLSKMIALRAGYKAGYDPSSITLGVGFINIIESAQVDYAYATLGSIDFTHRISITYKFGSDIPQKSPSKGKSAPTVPKSVPKIKK